MEQNVQVVEEKRGLTFLRNMGAVAGLGAMTLSTGANAALTAADITGPVEANEPLVAAAILGVLAIVLVIWGGRKIIGFFGR